MNKSFHKRLSERLRLASLWCLRGHTVANIEREAPTFERFHKSGDRNLHYMF